MEDAAPLLGGGMAHRDRSCHDVDIPTKTVRLIDSNPSPCPEAQSRFRPHGCVRAYLPSSISFPNAHRDPNTDHHPLANPHVPSSLSPPHPATGIPSPAAAIQVGRVWFFSP